MSKTNDGTLDREAENYAQQGSESTKLDIDEILRDFRGWVALAGNDGEAYYPLTEYEQEQLDEAKTQLLEWSRQERIAELELITKDTFDKPTTPENQNDRTWQGGYRFAKNSLKRYKLSRIKTLQSPQETKE